MESDNKKQSMVQLSLEEYNGMRDFQKEVTNGKIPRSISWDQGAYYYYTEREVIKDFEDEIKDLKKEIHKLTNPKEVDIGDVKKMSYWQFRKWKNNSKNYEI